MSVGFDVEGESSLMSRSTFLPRVFLSPRMMTPRGTGGVRVFRRRHDCFLWTCPKANGGLVKEKEKRRKEEKAAIDDQVGWG